SPSPLTAIVTSSAPPSSSATIRACASASALPRVPSRISSAGAPSALLPTAVDPRALEIVDLGELDLGALRGAGIGGVLAQPEQLARDLQARVAVRLREAAQTDR